MLVEKSMRRPEQARIRLGLYLDDNAEWLADTIGSLHASTHQAFSLCLLCAADADTEAAVRARFPSLPLFRVNGGAAAFNQLVAGRRADYYGLLEAGVRLAPGWLDRLLEALAPGSPYGLAGPSTNRAWQEQELPGVCDGSEESLRAVSEPLARRYGAVWQSLATEHSLGDFCYLVRHDVVSAIGGADERYGEGPCWELEYNRRAAGAGLLGAWVKGAYVHRAPVTERRQQRESRWLADNSRRYTQSNFKGEALMKRLPDPQGPLTDTAPPPLVSCIMPTRGRPAFVAQSIAYFLRQDYPQRELILLYETDDDLPSLPQDERLRPVRCSLGASIGAKRNQGVSESRGDIVAQWDDDDWYAPDRLTRQVEPLRLGLSELTGLTGVRFLDIRDGQYWQVSDALFARMFEGNVSGGTLVFQRRLREQGARYPDSSLREDAEFMLSCLQLGARLQPVAGRELCLYTRHGHNTWRFPEGRFLDPDQWWPSGPPVTMPEGDQRFYRGESAPGARRPKVSCIMPTANRPSFIAHAVEQFLAQTYHPRELIVLDDGDEPVAHLIPDRDDIRYWRLSGKRSVGAKRNLACERADGDIICHWDDDDWRAPDWIESQVQTLLETGAEVVGLDRVFFYEPAHAGAWHYIYDGDRPWACGGTLCYHRSYWQDHPFPDCRVGEDNAFVQSERPPRLAINSNGDGYVAIIHPDNTSPKNTGDRRWHPCPADRVRSLFTP